MREAKIRKINKNLDKFIRQNPVRTAHLRYDPEPFSRAISPYAELIQEIEDFVNVNLVSLQGFLHTSPGSARDYFDKTECYLLEIERRGLEMRRDFGQRVDLVIGKLKNLRKFLVQKI